MVFSVVDSVRFWMDLFEDIGKNPKTWDIIFNALLEMMRSVAKAEGGDQESLKRYPFHLLFANESSMEYVLKRELKYEDSDVERFNNLYLTPFFPLCVYDMVSFEFYRETFN